MTEFIGSVWIEAETTCGDQVANRPATIVRGYRWFRGVIFGMLYALKAIVQVD
jgi:hypothetical protein